MESQLGKPPTLSITTKLYLKIVYVCFYRKGFCYTVFTNNYWKETTTPWFYQLLLKGCYNTLFTSYHQKEDTTPLQACILPQHHPATLICVYQISRSSYSTILLLFTHRFLGLYHLLLRHGSGLQRQLHPRFKLVYIYLTLCLDIENRILSENHVPSLIMSFKGVNRVFLSIINSSYSLCSHALSY